MAPNTSTNNNSDATEPLVSHYHILEIKHNATTEDIKRAYRRVIRQWHPDRHHGASEARLKEITAQAQKVVMAHEVLMDDGKRKTYDIQCSSMRFTYKEDPANWFSEAWERERREKREKEAQEQAKRQEAERKRKEEAEAQRRREAEAAAEEKRKKEAEERRKREAEEAEEGRRRQQEAEDKKKKEEESSGYYQQYGGRAHFKPSFNFFAGAQSSRRYRPDGTFDEFFTFGSNSQRTTGGCTSSSSGYSSSYSYTFSNGTASSSSSSGAGAYSSSYSYSRGSTPGSSSSYSRGSTPASGAYSSTSSNARSGASTAHTTPEPSTPRPSASYSSYTPRPSATSSSSSTPKDPKYKYPCTAASGNSSGKRYCKNEEATLKQLRDKYPNSSWDFIASHLNAQYGRGRNGNAVRIKYNRLI